MLRIMHFFLQMEKIRSYKKDLIPNIYLQQTSNQKVQNNEGLSNKSLRLS